jgi:hypothetical protein
MSLIHEALKRVEANKAPTDPASPILEVQASRLSPVPQLRVASPSPMPLVPPPPPAPPGGWWRLLFVKSPIAMALAMAAAVGATMTAMSIVQRDMTALPTAVVPTAVRQASPAAAKHPKPARPAAAQPTRQPARPPKPPAAQRPAPVVETPSAAPAAVTPPASPAPHEAPSPPVAATVAPTPASRFKVTGIMSGPMGGAALINGRLIYVGQEVDGARLVSITANTVELEVAGVRFTLGIQP